jgi:hypothetical protein
MKFALTVFSLTVAMLPFGFSALFIVAANDEGMWHDGWLTKISEYIVTFFKLPLFSLESIFHKEMFMGSLFYIAYTIGILIWAIIILLIITLIKKLNKTS